MPRYFSFLIWTFSLILSVSKISIFENLYTQLHTAMETEKLDL